jgi:ornithine cyclodeaminase
VRLGVVGCGAQAETQLLAAAEALDLPDVAVFCRDEGRREAFAARLGAATRTTIRPAPSAEAAVRGRDVVILATSARAPVIEAGWVEPGAHVTTVAPKARAGHELPPELAERAALVVSDSPQQIRAAGEGHMLAGRPALARIEHLGGHLDGPPPPGPTLFLSAGLAGSEVACLRAVIEGTSLGMEV